MNLAALATSALLALAAPTATTGVAESITTGSAVVNGTVNPGGEATTYQVEYGTSTAYGVVTAAQSLPAGTDPVNVKVTLTGLTENTTYHYRVVATNASDTARGDDKTLKTATRAQAPSVTSMAQTGTTATGSTLRARVIPRSLATTVRFEYGTSTSYGTATPEQAIGAGSSSVTVSAPITGLLPNTRYYYRAVATSAAGVTRGSSRNFTTSRAPTAVAITPSTVRPIWGSGMTITGSVSGAGSTPVAVEKQDFPYTGPFTQIATATANSSGAFTLTVPPLFTTARLRVVTRTTVVATSPVATASVAVKVGLRSQRVRGRRFRLQGTVWPAVPSGSASLQRQSRSGRWGFVSRARPTRLDAGRSRYRFTVARRARATNYRIVVLARDGGAHVPGTSRTFTVPAR